ncbi:hypothetical protein jhhlp_007477 [Lomentospora prolificans]|uniref:Glyoxalase-like domain-containing protein n=1 Tax=Lomentospora prolificans TaxID=41688 RepID=A0A2N3N153_9PEZI|nr:hypothetical protein jhhlp_007477 [Lomentospora prolificans]
MSAADALPILDHIVILVSVESLQKLPKQLENALTVIDGGSHADGLTLNKLIIFRDGSYIELIAFRDNLDPERRHGHRWGSLKEGAIIDWAYTLADEKAFPAVQKRVEEASPETGVRYQDPVAGGRRRPDGAELKWAVSSAQDASHKPLWPGTAPFWCLDRTPRHLRVPYRDEETGVALPHTTHASGALGISQVFISVPEKEFSSTCLLYDLVHGPAIKHGSPEKAWHWTVYAGSSRGEQVVSLSASPGSKERHISLRLVGDQDSPRSIHVLPGLTLDFDNRSDGE